jgi:type I restriction-modification system DNA methylase subunit
MSLFHPRVIEKHIKHIQTVPTHHANGLSKWADNLERGIFDSETQNDGEFIQRILVEILGYVGSSDGEKWTVAKNQPVGKGNVDVALGYFTADSASILAPLELKGAKTRDLDAIMPGRNKSPVQQAWEYAMDAKGAQWVLVSNYREIRLYAVGYGRKEYESFEFSSLKNFESYARFMLLLSAQNLLNGKTLSLLKESEQAEKEISNLLYADYKALRRRMIESIAKDNPDRNQLDVIRCTQTILDRVLFVAFAEDKGLLPDKTLVQVYETKNPYNPQPIWENFKGLFQAINKGNAALNIPGYNGGLFACDYELDSLSVSDDLCEGFKKIGEYDFDSDVSVNILGHIFEQSIADIEELKAEGAQENFDKNKSKRKKDGIFYTPPYITRYIVEQSVGGWLADRRNEIGFDELPLLTDDDFSSIKVTGKRKIKHERNKNVSAHIVAWEAYRKELSNIKVLDPACGSGAFLNEVFDYLKKEGQIVNNQLARLTGEQTDLFRWDTHILANNIYGVDLNPESVEITKLSLWLKTANRNEKLTYLENNIKVGNSLVDDLKVAGELAFNWCAAFPSIMEAGGFDVVVGNPPWGAEIDNDQLAAIKSEHRDIIVRMVNSYMFFINHALRISKSNGYNGWVVPDSILYQSDNERLRDKIVSKYALKEVVNLGDAFEDVTQPCAIFILKVVSPSGAGRVKVIDASTELNKDVALSSKKSEEITLGTISALPGKIWPTKNTSYYSLLKNTSFKLSDFVDGDGIQRGASPDLKKAFIVDGEYVDKNRLESSFLKPTVTGGEDVKRFFIPQCEKHIIYISKSDSPTSFPNIFKHIQKYEDLISCKEVKQGKHPIYALHRPRNESIFQKKKKVIGVITGDKIITAVDEAALYPTDGLYLFGMLNQEMSDCIVAILNSRFMTFIYRLLSGEVGRVLAQVKPTILASVPVPDLSIKSEQLSCLGNFSVSIRNSLVALDELSANLMGLISADLGFTNSALLKSWYNLSVVEFLDNIERQIKPQKLSLQKKSEWISHFEAERTKAISIRNEINRLNYEIDQMVYVLYGLTCDEISIVECDV